MAAAGLRWWDGSDWTGHATGGPPAPAGPDLATNRTWADRATKAFLVQSAVQAVVALIFPVMFAGFFDALREAADASSDELAGTGDPSFGPGFLLGSLALNVLSLFSIAAVVVICVWSYNATTTARRLGRWTTHSPGWAVAGWFVPVVNYWFPYQVVRDLVPEGHPLRASAKRWWACYLMGAFLVVVPLVLSAFSLPLALAAALAPAGLSVVAGITGSRIATGAADDHEATAAFHAGP